MSLTLPRIDHQMFYETCLSASYSQLQFVQFFYTAEESLPWYTVLFADFTIIKDMLSFFFASSIAVSFHVPR